MFSVIAESEVLSASALRVQVGPGTILVTQPFRLEGNESLGIFGANGAGKTSLIRALAGELPLLSGHVRLLGQDITSQDVAARARAGLRYLPQANNTFPALTIEENLRTIIPSKSARSAATEQFLAALPHCSARTPVHLLSGGERQVLAVIMALSTLASVYLFDEPYSGIDVATSSILRVAIRDGLKRQGAAAIVIGHDRNQLKADCQRTVDLSEIAAIQSVDAPFPL